MQTAALAIILAFALWIAMGSMVAIARPATARGWIGRFATSHRVNFAEQAWRALAGAALLLRAPLAGWPGGFTIAGWVLLASAGALLVIPLRWHSGYAVWWSRNLPLPVVRVAGLAGLVLAGGMALLAVG